jgi:hypothetical protein
VPGALVAEADDGSAVDQGDRAEVDPELDGLAAVADPRAAEGAEVEVLEEARHVEAERLGVGLEGRAVERGPEQPAVHRPELPLGPGRERGLGRALTVAEAGHGQAARDDPEVVAVVLEQVVEDLPGAGAGRAGVVGEDDHGDQRGAAAQAGVIGLHRCEVAGLRDRRRLGCGGRVRLGTCGARRAGGQDQSEDEGDQNFGAHARPSRTGVR